MNLNVVFLILALGILGLAKIVRSLCLVRNTARPKEFLYTCFMTDDYLSDIKKAPIDIPRLAFSNSKIPIIRGQSFSRLGNYLERLLFVHCDVEDIEDNAFQGLVKLNVLSFGGNKLRIIKSAWFKGLANLKTVSFPHNRIKRIEDNFFSILPPLESLDISINEITCLPTTSFGNFKTDEFLFRQNRLTPMCQASVMQWLNDRNIKHNHVGYDHLDADYDITKWCVDKILKSQMSKESLDTCVEKSIRDFLPAKKNYTVRETCHLLENKPSPFLNCTCSI